MPSRTTPKSRRARPTAAPEPAPDPLEPPPDPPALHAWLREALGLTVPTEPLLDGHAAPFDYLVHAFFEGSFVRASGEAGAGGGPAWAPGSLGPDCVVWANRGGGKTFLGAVATLLDLVFKPGVQVRILAGSLEQSRRMFDHLRDLLERPRVRGLVAGRPTARRVALTNGSAAELLAASQTSVRGTRVQKIRCDEVDLFTDEVWEAAQLVTRSLARPGPWGPHVRGSVEALSTMHRPFGPMWKLVSHALGAGAAGAVRPTVRGRPVAATAPAPGPGRPLFRWGLVDVLERCPQERECGACALEPECGGRAKARPAEGAGHVRVADALAMKARVGAAVWDAEMLCLRPRRTDAVYPEFDPAVHVVGDGALPGARAYRRFVAGMDFGHRAEGVVLLAGEDDRGVLVVLREHAARRMLVREHAAVVRGWAESGLCDGAAEPGLAWVGVDPAGLAESGQSGLSDARVVEEAGLTVRSRRAGVRAGINLVRARLEPAGGARPGAGAAPGPRLLVHRSCTRLIECLTRYRFDEAHPESETPVKDGHDHACDALRYLVLCVDAGFTLTTSSYLR